MNERVKPNLPGRTAAVIAEIERRIAARSLVTGARLPSVRGLAGTMGVSPSTVVEAYERLVASGIIHSRPGSGFFVSGAPLPLQLSEIGPRLDREVDPLWISRQALGEGADLLKPGCGWLPPSFMPVEAIRRALRGLGREEDSALTDYDTPLGLAGLRHLLSRRLLERGVPATPEQVVLTESGTQAIDLVCRFLIEPGDTVLLDDPCYFNFHALMRAHRARTVGVPMTPEGPDLAAFADIVARERPRLYITTSAIHNPTGVSMSPIVAHRLLKLAAEHGLTIIEDDIFGDLETVPGPRLAAIDGLSRVVQVGSFSKTLSASVRCGYVALKPEWVEALTDLKIATNFTVGRLSAELVHALLKDGSYRRHLDGLKVRLGRAMDEVEARVRTLGLVPFIRPSAGIFLWCRLPDGLDAAEIARTCLKDGIVLAPGATFSPSGQASAYLRFNVAQSADPAIWESLEKAIAAAR